MQERSVEVLCSAIVRVAEERCTDMLPEAQKVYDTYSPVLTLFGKCHRGYNSGAMDESSINELGMSKQ